MTHTPYKPGDRVVGVGWLFRDKTGRVSKAGRGATVTVTWDGRPEPERVYLDNLRHETARDIAKRDFMHRIS